MATKTYSQKITNAKVLIDGLKKIKSNLPAGITDDTILNLETLREKIETLNSENEGLKAESKKKTEDINSKLKELDKLYSQMKKRVKLDIEPSLWGKFGIEDKRYMIILQLKANIILNLFLLAFFFYYKYLSGVLINLDY